MERGTVVKDKDMLFLRDVLYVQRGVSTGLIRACTGLHLLLAYWTLLFKPFEHNFVESFGPLF